MCAAVTCRALANTVQQRASTCTRTGGSHASTTLLASSIIPHVKRKFRRPRWRRGFPHHASPYRACHQTMDMEHWTMAEHWTMMEHWTMEHCLVDMIHWPGLSQGSAAPLKQQVSSPPRMRNFGKNCGRPHIVSIYPTMDFKGLILTSASTLYISAINMVCFSWLGHFARPRSQPHHTV